MDTQTSEKDINDFAKFVKRKKYKYMDIFDHAHKWQGVLTYYSIPTGGNNFCQIYFTLP